MIKYAPHAPAVFKTIFHLLWVFFALVMLTSCNDKKDVLALRPETRGFYPDRVNYYLNQYEQHGRRNPKWDQAMRRLIIEENYSTYLPDPKPTPGVLKQFKILDEAKCDDAYFRYLSACYLHSRITQPYPYITHTKAALAFASTTYGPFLRAVALHDAAKEAYHQTDKARRKLCFKLQADAFTFFLEAIADPTIPDEVLSAPIQTYIAWSMRAESVSEVVRRTEVVMATVRQHRPERPLMVRLLGQLEINLAWSDRGSDWAYQVTSEGWEGFSDHLAKAEKLLEHSWELQPTSRTAIAMMSVELGQARGRERLETWFNRAMEMNPGSTEACYSKLHYLRPRWHGSEEEMLQFGVQCAENPAWTGRVPLVLAFAMENYIADYADPDKAKLWKDPKVWALVKKSYDAYIKRYPKDEEIQHEYLEKAYRSEAWEDFDRQFKKLDSIKQIYLPMKRFQPILEAYANYQARKANALRP